MNMKRSHRGHRLCSLEMAQQSRTIQRGNDVYLATYLTAASHEKPGLHIHFEP